MVGHSNRPLLGSLEEVLQLARRASEAVQGPVLAEAVDPLPSRRNPGRHKVATLPLPRLERLDDLRAEPELWVDAQGDSRLFIDSHLRHIL